MLIIAARIIWQIYPNLLCCMGFWAVVLWLNRPTKKSPRALLVFLGSACNAFATIANDGKMPVLGRYGSPVSVWRTAQPGDHLLILCDRFGRFSIGDMLIGGWFVLAIGLWLWKEGASRPLFSGEKQRHDAEDAKADGCLLIPETTDAIRGAG
jgi:hypothetical protein